MGLFLPTFFQTRPRRTFTYKPRYYDEEQERLDLLKKKYAAQASEPSADGSDADAAAIAAMKARMRYEFEAQRPQRKTKGLLSRRALCIAVMLVIGLLFFIL